jgi:hypothetical protein
VVLPHIRVLAEPHAFQAWLITITDCVPMRYHQTCTNRLNTGDQTSLSVKRKSGLFSAEQRGVEPQPYRYDPTVFKTAARAVLHFALLLCGAQGGTCTHDFTDLQSVAFAALPPVHCVI